MHDRRVRIASPILLLAAAAAWASGPRSSSQTAPPASQARSSGPEFTGYESEYRSMAVSPDGRFLVSGDKDKGVVLWDMKSGKPVRFFKGHTDVVSSVAFSKDGKRVLSGAWDKTIRLWDVATGEALRTIDAGGDEIFSVAFSPDGKTALSGGRGQVLRLWDLATGRPLKTLKGHTGTIVSVAFSPDGRYAVSGSFDQKAMIWDLNSGERLHTLSGHTHWVMGVRFTPDQRYVVSAGDETVRLWDAKTGALVRAMRQPHVKGGVILFAQSPDGRYVLSEGAGYQFTLWDVRAGKLVRTFVSRGGSPDSAAFTPDGKSILAAIKGTGETTTIFEWPADGSQGALAAASAAQAPAAALASASEFEGAVDGVPNTHPAPGQVELGKYLFFDKSLSRDRTVSCATCHDPRKGWTDHLAVSTGIHGHQDKRNAPTLLNVAYQKLLFWDGRASTLEQQAQMAMTDPNEMDADVRETERRVAAVPGYRPYFQKAYGSDEVTIDRITQAISAFERSLVSMDAPYDRYLAGDKKAMSPEALHGRELFFSKANCYLCHTERNAHHEFRNIGIGSEKDPPDLGRYEVSKDERERGAYKIPTLRNLRYSYPYMHDGSIPTLEAVVDFYNAGGRPNKWLDFKMEPLHLTQAEKSDLVRFLESLSGDPLQIAPPAPLQSAQASSSR